MQTNPQAWRDVSGEDMLGILHTQKAFGIIMSRQLFQNKAIQRDLRNVIDTG